MFVAHSWLTLCNPVDCSPPDPSIHGILQARTLEWAAIPFFRGSFWPRGWTQVSCMASGFFTIWVTRKAQIISYLKANYCILFHTSVHLLLSLQSCPTLCDPIDGSPPGSLVPGILQARTLEWGAIAFSVHLIVIKYVFIEQGLSRLLSR